MDITGRIIAALPERSGTSSRNGSQWRVASYVLETQEQYPRKICFEVFSNDNNDRITAFNIQVGEVLNVSFDIDAHEYQGRWYNQIRAFRVDRNLQATPDGVPTPDGAPVPPPVATPFGAAPAQAPAPVAPAAPAPEANPFGGEAGDETDLPF